MSKATQFDLRGKQWAQRIARDTERLRTSADPALRRVRELIDGQGVSPDTALVANLMPEDESVLSGFIVSADGRVFEFEYDWHRTDPDQGRLSVWRDITNSYESRAFREPISIARALSREPEPAITT